MTKPIVEMIRGKAPRTHIERHIMREVVEYQLTGAFGDEQKTIHDVYAYMKWELPKVEDTYRSSHLVHSLHVKFNNVDTVTIAMVQNVTDKEHLLCTFKTIKTDGTT